MHYKLGQLGIAIATLGAVITIIGLFPGVIGLEQAGGVGVLQILVAVTGFSLLISGAYIFVQSTFYPDVKHILAQEIAIRLSMTGLIISAASGLADVLGFGTHPPLPGQRPLLGTWQLAGLLGGFIIASLGVVLFAVLGPHHTDTE
jgi:hypothetical protein